MKFSLILFSLFSVSVCASSNPFKIFPYMIKNQRGEHLLRFELNKTMDIVVDYQLKSSQKETKGSIHKGFKRNILQTVNLGGQTCDTEVGYKLIDAHNSQITYAENEVSLYPCRNDDVITFGFMSDTQERVDRHQKVAKVIASKLHEPLNFIINAGDIVHHGSVEEQWVRFFKTAKPYLSKIPLIPVIGNHEYKKYDSLGGKIPPHFKKYMRWDGINELGSYVVSFPQFDLVVFNSNFTKLKESQIQGQMKWLQQQIKRAEQNRKHVVFTMHHSPFNSNFEYFRKVPRRLRSDLVPILEKSKNVVLVLSGHVHLYERSYKDGIHYVVAGPSGGKRNIVTNPNKWKKVHRTGAWTFSLFKVSSTQILMETYDHEGIVVDVLEVPLSINW